MKRCEVKEIVRSVVFDALLELRFGPYTGKLTYEEANRLTEKIAREIDARHKEEA